MFVNAVVVRHKQRRRKKKDPESIEFVGCLLRTAYYPGILWIRLVLVIFVAHIADDTDPLLVFSIFML